ncbi:MAG: 5-(carboxyamino)imidazole ribonucleotide synthase [Spirochaetes bacterium]|nr:5-(carboxyamino)imidazole ribonucleotide synthase [Spirochaetota bacterium]
MKPTTIGILGGGQLARMTIAAAMRFGIRCHVLDKNNDAPAAPYTRYFTQGDPQDYQTVLEFARSCDAITIDSEHVNAAALSALSASGVRVAPQGDVLEIIQNKCRQKIFLAQAGFPTAPFQIFKARIELEAASLKFPVVQKRATHGYDGQGVIVLNSAVDLARAFDGESVIEEKIAIAKELAVIVATDFALNRVVYDPVEMVFDVKRNILKYQLAPAAIDVITMRRVQELALSVAEKLGVHGLLAVEMFLTHQGEILINEMAPRPHNSGHHTIEAAATSQYENLVRILTALPVGNAATTAPSLMLNLLGPELGAEAQFEAMITAALKQPNAHVHLYGKREVRPYRKLGHITLVGERDALIRQYEDLSSGGVIEAME